MQGRLALLSLLILQTIASYADFPTEYFPDGPRPRLWLTQERLSELQKARDMEAFVWQEFSSETDRYLTEDHWDGPAPLIPYMALMYVLTEDQKYADRAFELMDQLPDTPEPTYSIYTHHCYAALAFDWLYTNPAMTPTRRETYARQMTGWSDLVWQEINHEGTVSESSRELIASGAAHLLFGCALYGETPEAQTMLDRAWLLWEQGQGPVEEARSISSMIRETIGGHWYRGMPLFQGIDQNGLTVYWTTLRTACGYDIDQMEPELAPFWPNVLRTILDLTDPPRARFHHTGETGNENVIVEWPWALALLNQAIYLSAQSGNEKWASYGQYYAEEIDGRIEYINDDFWPFFFFTPSVENVDPYHAGIPPIRYCPGLKWLFFRDSWETSANWGMLSGQGSTNIDGHMLDVGHFTLWREDDFLTKDCPQNSSYYGTWQAFNSLSIQNGEENGKPIQSEPRGPASFERYRINNTEPLFAYAMIQADDQWDGEDIARVDSYPPPFLLGRRLFNYSRPCAHKRSRLGKIPAARADSPNIGRENNFAAKSQRQT